MNMPADNALERFYESVSVEHAPETLVIEQPALGRDATLGACAALGALLLVIGLSALTKRQVSVPLVIGADAYAQLVAPPPPRRPAEHIQGERWTTRLV